VYEVELKVRADHDAVAAALADGDAEALGRVEQVDTYYDAPHREFAATDEALRIRRERPLPDDGSAPAGDPDEAGARSANDGDDAGEVPEADGDGGGADDGDDEGTTRLTYKGPLVEAESKTREEFETAVADGAAAAGILDGLGFEPAAEVRKRRRRYRLDGYVVTLDDVDGVGEFMEVETEATAEGIERAREGAADLVRSLGLDPDEQIRTSYLGLALDADSSE